MPKSNRTMTRRAGAVVVAAATLLAAAGCGSSSSSSAKTVSSGGKKLGSPVKIGLIGSFKTATYDATSEISATKAAALAINDAGGIDGHAVDIVSCNDQFSVVGASACGREMIADHVLAVTGASIFDAAFQPALATAGIPIVGYYASSLNAYTGKNEYLLTPGTLFELYGATYLAAKAGVKKVYVSRADVAVTAAIAETVEAVAAKAGYKYAGDQAIPTTATDLSPYVQQFISSGADGVVLGYAAQVADTYVSTAHSIGLADQKLIYTAGNLQNSDISAMGPAAANLILAGGLPPVSATQIPGIQLFLKQLAAERATGDATAVVGDQSETSLQSWLAVQAIAKVAPKTGPLDAATLTAALNTAKNVSLMGLIPPWTPAKPGPAPYTRVSNPDVYSEKVVNGQLVLAGGTTEVDVPAALGI